MLSALSSFDVILDWCSFAQIRGKKVLLTAPMKLHSFKPFYMLIYPAQANLGAIQKMPRSYSDDLRCKILLAYEAGEGSLEELAEDFGVSYGYTKKIRQQQRRSGQMQCTPQHYPSQSPLDENRRLKVQEWG